MPSAELRTDRLWLRPWRADDREPFAALNADPVVMEHFPALLSRAESDAFADRIEARFAANGFGLWAVEVVDSGDFIGFVGLNPVPQLPISTPDGVEIGWRLARPAWGQGFASEAARAALRYGFADAGLHEIVSFTATTNLRSQRVMERIGMIRDTDSDFDHPALPVGHPLRRHVLFRISADQCPVEASA